MVPAWDLVLPDRRSARIRFDDLGLRLPRWFASFGQEVSLTGGPEGSEFCSAALSSTPCNKPLQADKSSRAWSTSAAHELVSFGM